MKYLNVIKLTNDKLTLKLLPEIGGRINELVFDKFDIFHPFQIEDTKPLQSYKGGSFCLVPFSNRIKNSKFNFNQLEFNLTKNDPPNAIHGHAYLGKWNILKKTDSSAIIVYKHLANKFGWPWSYEVFQTITLEDNNIFFESLMRRKLITICDPFVENSLILFLNGSITFSMFSFEAFLKSSSFFSYIDSIELVIFLSSSSLN